MKTYLISYSTKEFRESQGILRESAIKYGVDEVISYTEDDLLKTEFYLKHKQILDRKRGAGYWLWKPYFILKTLERIEDGDILIYADSGIKIVSDLKPLIDICKNKKDIVSFNDIDYINKVWTKRDCFVLMDCDSERYWNARHRTAAFHLHMKSKGNIYFIKEWLRYCSYEDVLTDKSNSRGDNLDGFIEHRHDQSIFSLLTVKYDKEMFRNPSQYGNYLKLPEFRRKDEFLQQDYVNDIDKCFINSKYDTIIDHHRNKSRVSNRFYSQCNQDKFIFTNFFRHKSHGFFVDIGAADGIEISNTYFFEKNLEWKGICVEPRKSTYNKLVENRKSFCENVCISDHAREQIFYEFNGDGIEGLFSGLKDKYDRKHADFIRSSGQVDFHNMNKLSIKTITFNELCKKYNVKHIDYCSIDTEGGELDILKSLGNDVSIDCISIENNYFNKQIRHYLISKDFIFVTRLGYDEIYVSKRFKLQTYKFILIQRLRQIYHTLIPTIVRKSIGIWKITGGQF